MRLDPPKSTPHASSRQSRRTQWLPLKRGTLIRVPPFLRGVRGDQQVPKITARTTLSICAVQKCVNLELITIYIDTRKRFY
jgi:hypothetical protein